MPARFHRSRSRSFVGRLSGSASPRFAVSEIVEKWRSVTSRPAMTIAAGFCGMFVCGGPIYEAAVTTTAINMGLIMAATPVVVLLISWILRLESIKPWQMLSVALALPGVS